MNRNLFPNLTRLSFMILHEVNMDYMRGSYCLSRHMAKIDSLS